MESWSEFSISLKGSETDLKKMLDVISGYQRDSGRDEYYEISKINDERVTSLSNEMIESLDLTKGKISICGNGPWGGNYILTHQDALFKEMAEAVPEASFDAEISWSGTYENQILTCVLRKKHLKMEYTYSSTTVDVDEKDRSNWVSVFVDKLPLDSFVKMFKVSDLGNDPDKYADFVGSCFYGYGIDTNDWLGIPYDYFVDELEDIGAKTDLDEDEFFDFMGEVGLLDIPDIEIDDDSEYEATYDPVAKKYIKAWDHPF